LEKKGGGDTAPQNLIPLMDKANQGPVKKQPWERKSGWHHKEGHPLPIVLRTAQRGGGFTPWSKQAHTMEQAGTTNEWM